MPIDAESNDVRKRSSLSRSARAARIRSVTSRAMPRTPTISPPAPWIADASASTQRIPAAVRTANGKSGTLVPAAIAPSAVSRSALSGSATTKS